ncbi:hypothetical protein KUV57_13835 [Epibacterium sp. DP7N7-1]|nr:hypothetical protein [Epibacterium sp. DP7N7-1]
MSQKVPSWTKTDPQYIVWMMGSIDAVSAGHFSHGPSSEKEDFLHHAQEGDILLARDVRDQSLVAMHIAYDNQFLRLNQGMSGKLFETISENMGNGMEQRRNAMRLTSSMSKMPVLPELSDQSLEALREGYMILEDGVKIAREILNDGQGEALATLEP